MHLILFSLATVGLCNILVDSKIVKPVRDFFAYYPFKEDKTASRLSFLDCKVTRFVTEFANDVLSCHTCCGWWSGLVVSSIAFELHWKFLFLGAFAGSFICTAANSILEALEASAILNMPEDE